MFAIILRDWFTGDISSDYDSHGFGKWLQGTSPATVIPVERCSIIASKIQGDGKRLSAKNERTSKKERVLSNARYCLSRGPRACRFERKRMDFEI